MKRYGLAVIILLLLSAISVAQEKEQINIVDRDGLKQGRWIKTFENGNTLYEGVFKDNEPVGEFIRYYISGKPISNLYYHPLSDSIDAVFFIQMVLSLRGVSMLEKQKEDKWEFFSATVENCIICSEYYINNMKEGESTKYHTNGNKAEELIYSGDLRNGKWLQYFTDGTLCIKSAYRNDTVAGSFETFHPNGKREIVGNYVNNTRDGKWIFYNEDGSFKREIIYHQGVAENNAELIDEETRYLDQLEKDGGKIKDPAKTGFIIQRPN